MNTEFLSKSEGGLYPSPPRAAEGDGGNGRWDTVFRRLSRLESGMRHHPTNTGFLKRPELPARNERRRSWDRVRFVLIDQAGPVAQFQTWEDAYRYMTTMELPGASIICVEQRGEPTPLEELLPSAEPSNDKTD